MVNFLLIFTSGADELSRTQFTPIEPFKNQKSWSQFAFIVRDNIV